MQLSNFACPGHVLILLLADHLAGRLPIGQVRMKSYLPGRKLSFLYDLTVLFGALHVFANSEWNDL